MVFRPRFRPRVPAWAVVMPLSSISALEPAFKRSDTRTMLYEAKNAYWARRLGALGWRYSFFVGKKQLGAALSKARWHALEASQRVAPTPILNLDGRRYWWLKCVLSVGCPRARCRLPSPACSVPRVGGRGAPGAGLPGTYMSAPAQARRQGCVE